VTLRSSMVEGEAFAQAGEELVEQDFRGARRRR
jgi:hypothetical protein